MKPWHAFTLLLGAMIVVPLFSQTTSSSLVSFNFPQKILGKPAGRDWIEIPSDPNDGVVATYQVPQGKVLCLANLRCYPHAAGWDGSMAGVPRFTVLRDAQPLCIGVSIFQHRGDQTDDIALSLWDIDNGEVRTTLETLMTATEGQIISLSWDGSAWQHRGSYQFYLCGWLEDA